MTSSYITEALRACRLPIRVNTLRDGQIVVWHGMAASFFHSPLASEYYYVDVRDQMLAGQKEDE